MQRPAHSVAPAQPFTVDYRLVVITAAKRAAHRAGCRPGGLREQQTVDAALETLSETGDRFAAIRAARDAADRHGGV